MSGWEAKGFQGLGCGDLIDSLKGPAIIMGSAKGVFEELSAARSALGRSYLAAVNDAIVYASNLDFALSLHTLRLDHWVGLRRDPTSMGYGNTNFRVMDGGLHGPREWHQWTDLTPTLAHSGMFAMQAMFLMGCSPIYLCGCPEDATPRFWESEPRPEKYYKPVQRQIEAEMNRLPEFKRVVRSCSGWTKDYFGNA
jgi:hypothetical protein